MQKLREKSTQRLSWTERENERVQQMRAVASAPYEGAVQRLQALWTSLNIPEEVEPEPQVPEPVTYPTGFGTLTFDEIHNRTRGLAAHIMRKQYGLENEDDINDSLQFGYLKLWEKLQTDPGFAEGKSDRFVARSVCFRAKNERFRHLRHITRNDILPEETHAPGFRAHSWESRLSDLRIDLEWALAAVAAIFDNEPQRMMALYYATTDVTIKDMQELGLSRHTLRDHTRDVRTLLQAHLRGESDVGAAWQR